VPQKLDLPNVSKSIRGDFKGQDEKLIKGKSMFLSTKTCLSLPTYLLLAREKSSAAKDMIKSVPVALLIFLAANNNLLFSCSAIQLQPNKTKLL
jgi:hypothetical protein